MKHDDRMAMLALSLHPPHWSAIFPEFQKRLNESKDDPRFKQALKKSWQVATATVRAYLDNGAGSDGDEMLRYFLLDSCNRFWSLGVWDSLPTSFNVSSDFLNYSPRLNFFAPHDEQHHDFSFADFLDFATDPGISAEPLDVERFMPQGMVYHFTNTAPLRETTVGDSGTHRFVLASCSMIRHGTELSMCVVAGQPMRASREILRHIAESTTVMTPGKEKLDEIATDDPREAVALRGDREWWKIVLLTRIDLVRRTFQVRYVLRDCGDMFDVLTDDPSIWLDSRGQPIDANWEDRLKHVSENLKEYRALFELVHYCTMLPHYFSARPRSIKPRIVRTQFGLRQSSVKYQRSVASAQAGARVAFRTVFEMHPGDLVAPNIVVTPSTLRIERSGFWKALAPGKHGVDRDGNPVQGKTWVSKELTWVESDAVDPLFIERESGAVGSDPGQVYVMRNAAHPEDVFKIGMTRRDSQTRADELSADTGVVDRFLLVQRWNVGDCAAAERLIHERLDAYRLTGQREFFKAPYDLIRHVIEQIMDVCSAI